jgi:hypothetical protein
LATVVFPNARDETPAGQRVVKLTLERWTIKQNDGTINALDKFLAFSDLLHEVLEISVPEVSSSESESS